MLEEYIKKLRPEVEKLFSADSSGHDIGHLERTMNNALFIQKHEGGDELIIGVSAFLHDVHRILCKDLGKYCSPKESLPTINEILKKVNFPEEKINKVLSTIEFHEEYNWNNSENKNTNIETLILQDADNLEAIGAIGIARCFFYASTYNIPMYDSNIPINEKNDFSEEGEDDPSSIHHFYHKLLKIGEHMNTKTARELAKKRTKFVEEFIKELMEEWNI